MDILKAQHPYYEVYLTGINAQRGVACSDCHMQYIKEGGQKFTSHPEKAQWIEAVLSAWDKKAKEREDLCPVQKEEEER